jgi:acylphosphatase
VKDKKRANPMTIQAKHIIVYGRVQGVGFRKFVHLVGNRLKLTGNVRNCPDSTVAIVVEGTSGKIADFIKEVEKGPALSRVDRVNIADIPVQGEYGSFSIEGW